jgi:hypothetical protein
MASMFGYASFTGDVNQSIVGNAGYALEQTIVKTGLLRNYQVVLNKLKVYF